MSLRPRSVRLRLALAFAGALAARHNEPVAFVRIGRETPSGELSIPALR